MEMQANQSQQEEQHYENDQFENEVAPASWQTPLTSSTLRQLRRNDDIDRTAQPISPIMSRRTSIDSDRISTVSGLTNYFPNNPTNVNPAPAYVAASGASQVVSEHLSAKRRPFTDEEEDDDEKLNKDDVQFAEPALSLVNAFLDQLLYSFLSTARSTSLYALRPAVTEVLKHRLAREAIASAQEELAELLAGGEDEEDMDTKHKVAEDSRRWDLELVWKRTRLRVMVYMRLGEMEDEDEQRYVKEEELFQGSERRFSQTSGLVSWAAAIFLTSVLEYVAEQTLQVAGQAAYTRARRQSRTQRLTRPDAQPSEDLVVEEYDVEKVALNSTLGRLWRTWRKALRNNTTPSTPTHRSSHSIGRTSRDNMTSAMSQRHASYVTAREGSIAGESRPMSRDEKDDPNELEYPEHVLAANIPLPVGNASRDIDEIHVPGLARDPDAKEEDADTPDTPYSEELLGSLVALPISDEKTDVDEIEVPGLARDPDAVDEISSTQVSKKYQRRNSFGGSSTTDSRSSDIYRTTPTVQQSMPFARKQRSTSVPHPARVPMITEEQNEPVEEQIPIDNTEGHQMADNDVKEETDAEANKQTERSQPEAAVDQESKGEFPWMTKAASAASAAAANAWALGSKKTEYEQYPEERAAGENIAQPKSSSRSTRGFGGLIESASQGESSRENEPKGLLDVKKGSSQQSLSDKDIEELDKRKSLIDIKAMMVVNGSSGPTSGQESPAVSQTPPNLVRGTSGASKTSGDDADYVPVEEASGEAIGVVQSANMPTSDRETQEAREPAQRPPRLIIGDAAEGKLDDSSVTQAQPSTPPTVQRQYLDLTSEASGVDRSGEADDTDERPRLETRPSQRASPPNVAYSPSVGSSPHQQSISAPVEQNSSAIVAKQSSESALQEHPVIQRMANSKSIEPKSPRSPQQAGESDKGVPLTSASIRGPEDFDMFVQGDETVKYTLTPENVRDQPILDATPYPKAGGSPVEMDATSQSRKGRSQDTKQAPSTTAEEEERIAAKRRSISRPSATNLSIHSRSGLTAREPRVMTESTRDFADFIRSTGPGKETTVYPIMANASTTSLHSLRSAHINGAATSRSSSPGGDRSRKPVADSAIVPPVPPIPARSKSTMQPRGPTSVSGGSAELIDFIRSGPDQQGKHRISRSVAPFRSTMDSDQFRDLGDRLSTDKSSGSRLDAAPPSVQSTTSIVSSSQRTSANSRSALLNGSSNANQTVQPAYSGQPQTLSQNLSAGQKSRVSQDNEPTRKRHRNKDPYAMYYENDDEDEDLLTSLPKTTRREESLVDFLNNNEPPAANAPRPLVNPDSAQARAIIEKARANGIGAQGPGTAVGGKARTVPMPRSGYASPAYSMQSNQQAAINNSGLGPATGRAKMQARGGAKDIALNSNTKELADFFKSSGPEDPQSAPAPIVGRRLPSNEIEMAKKKAEKKKIGGFFGRSRKKTYLDMS